MVKATNSIAGRLALMIASAFLVGACATPAASTSDSRPSTSKAAKEDFVTGSRIPRSDNNENFQGAKTMTGREAQDYMDTLGRRDKAN
jgi:hypothetical protein